MINPTDALDRSVAPATRPFGNLVLPEGKTITLDSGIRVHIFPGDSAGMSRLTLLWRGGEHQCNIIGRATLAMSAMREANDRLSATDMAEMLDFNSARLVSLSTKYTSMLRLTCAAGRLSDVMPDVIACVLAPAMPTRSVEVLLENAAVSAAIADRQVAQRARRQGNEMLFGPTHPACRVATPDQLRSLTRNDLMATYSHICNPGNLPEVYVAGCTDASVMNAIETAITNLTEPAVKGHADKHIEGTPMNPEAPGETTVVVDGAVQSAICINFPSITRDNPDYAALRTTIMALGGYFGSRLMTNIREDKGYTYGIGASLLCDADGGYISINSQQDPAYTRAVIDETYAEINRLRDTLLPADELERLRNHALSEAATVLDTPLSISEYRMCEFTEGMPHDYYHTLQQQIHSITPEVIRDMARRYLHPSEARVAIAQPAD